MYKNKGSEFCSWRGSSGFLFLHITMDDFINSLWIDFQEEILQPKQKEEKKKKLSKERLERQRKHIEEYELALKKRQEKKEKWENRKKRPWYCCLISLVSGLYYMCWKRKIKHIEKTASKMWWEILHTRKVDDIILASYTRKRKLRKYAINRHTYNLPKSEVDRILSLTK